jgi:hypothetical protein
MAHKIREWRDVTPQRFEADIRPIAEPAVLRGFVHDWPIVSAARRGDLVLVEYLKGFASPGPVPVNIGPPEIEGCLHYKDDMRGLNFQRRSVVLTVLLEQLVAQAEKPTGISIAAQGFAIPDLMPDFCADHPMPLVPVDTVPRFWIGNAVKVATHNDSSENIACVVAGCRRFTLFAPEQIANLYIGPFMSEGTPISMVHVTQPDHLRYPRYAAAEASALVAELKPGDALYIPYRWYHHVESLDAINGMINYWWDPARKDLGSAANALLHGMMTLRSLPLDQRRAWRAAFDHYVFLLNDDPGAHLPEHARGVLAADAPADIAKMRSSLIQALTKVSRQN